MAVLYIVVKHIPLMQHCFSFLSFLLFRFLFFPPLCHFISLHNIADKKVLKERLIHVHQRSLYVSLSLPFFNRFIVLPGKKKHTRTTGDRLTHSLALSHAEMRTKKKTPATAAPCCSQIGLVFTRSHSNQGGVRLTSKQSFT